MLVISYAREGLYKRSWTCACLNFGQVYPGAGDRAADMVTIKVCMSLCNVFSAEVSAVIYWALSHPHCTDR